MGLGNTVGPVAWAHAASDCRAAILVRCSCCSLIVRRAVFFGSVAVVLRRGVSKDAELLVSRHENVVLRCQILRVRYESAGRLLFAALSSLIPPERGQAAPRARPVDPDASRDRAASAGPVNLADHRIRRKAILGGLTQQCAPATRRHRQQQLGGGHRRPAGGQDHAEQDQADRAERRADREGSSLRTLSEPRATRVPVGGGLREQVAAVGFDRGRLR